MKSRRKQEQIKNLEESAEPDEVRSPTASSESKTNADPFLP